VEGSRNNLIGFKSHNPGVVVIRNCTKKKERKYLTFSAFGDARSRFDIRFYLVSILFIIPDPEVTFSFPWAVPPNKIDPFGSWSMMAFLLILTIGSLYEWKRGASDRE